ncbi:hypothetical protein ACFYO0_19555 [Streptomyces sp. NPDC006365]|uniref:hypothetical protein n=1 Tax=Streptomyces sp. NPDC006365 TaxID=3364744 RepID=UPI0036BE695B
MNPTPGRRFGLLVAQDQVEAALDDLDDRRQDGRVFGQFLAGGGGEAGHAQGVVAVHDAELCQQCHRIKLRLYQVRVL